MTWFFVAAAAVTAVGTVYAGHQQEKAAKRQASIEEEQAAMANAIARENAEAEREVAGERAEKVRKAGRRQRASARAALAKSGAGGLSSSQIESFISGGAESDALSEILGGERRAFSQERSGQVALRTGEMRSGLLRQTGRDAAVGSYISATGTLLGGYSRTRKPGYTYQGGD